MWENSREHKSWLLEYCNNFEDEVLGMLRTVIWEVFELKKKKRIGNSCFASLLIYIAARKPNCEILQCVGCNILNTAVFVLARLVYITPDDIPADKKEPLFSQRVVLASLKTAMLLWISVYLNSYCLNYKKTWEVYNDVKCLLVLRLSTKFKLVTVWQKVERKRPLQALAFSKAWF